MRLQHLDDVLFPIEVHPVFADVDGGGWRESRQVRIPGKNAIVNMSDHSVVGVVGTGYKLVTNHEAIGAAKKCCREVFPETQLGEWKISAVDAPRTGSYCHVDLVHNTRSLNFEFLMQGARPDVPEAFGPFIRVTNSYNGRRALAFSIGFYRKVCANGLVGPEEIIRFRFDHTQSDLGAGIRFNVEHDRLEKMKKDFLDCFQVLRNCPIDPAHFKTLILGVLRLKEPKEIRDPNHKDNRQKEEWLRLENHLVSLSDRYKEQGENAYAVLNSITELASHPPINRHIKRDKHSLQKLAGEWLVAFSRQCRQPSFSINDYLADLAAENHSEPAIYERARPG